MLFTPRACFFPTCSKHKRLHALPLKPLCFILWRQCERRSPGSRYCDLPHSSEAQEIVFTFALETVNTKTKLEKMKRGQKWQWSRLYQRHGAPNADCTTLYSTTSLPWRPDGKRPTQKCLSHSFSLHPYPPSSPPPQNTFMPPSAAWDCDVRLCTCFSYHHSSYIYIHQGETMVNDYEKLPSPTLSTLIHISFFGGRL